MAIKVLVTGDIHIGKRSSGIKHEADEGATKFSWIRIVEYAIANNIDVVALTGDVVDQDNRYFEAIGPLQLGFEKLRKASIAVYMVSGNHDYEVLNQLVRGEAFDNIHLLGARGKWEMKKFLKNGKEIQFIGWSFPETYITVDPLISFDLDGLNSSIPTIGLLHGDVGVPDSNYAPLSIDTLRSQPVDVWLLGHIHKAGVLREAAPMVLYPGSPHALSAKETGAHGPTLLTVYSSGHIERKQILLSPVRYEVLEIDVSGKNTKDDARSSVAAQIYENAQLMIKELGQVYFLIFDILLVGQHGNIKELEEWLQPMVQDYERQLELTETKIYVRKIKLNVKAEVENLEELAKELSPAGILAKTIISLNEGKSTEFSDRLLERMSVLQKNTLHEPVFQPIRNIETSQRPETAEAKEYLLLECNRILTNLLEQQNQ